MLATWHWHIEVSSKCTLHCPRCARQEVPAGLVNTELDLDFFKRNFTPEFVQANVEKITFCGDDGDPIYAHDLIDIIAYLKSIKPVEIVIITNGSHKKVAWWQQLAKVLTAKDTVHFSIDGYNQETNNLYRKNSNFIDIINAISTLTKYSECYLVWAAIAFKFNEQHLDHMRNIAIGLGMDLFQLTKSTKFGSVYPIYTENDPLEPSTRFISSTHRFEREYTRLSNRQQHSADHAEKLYNQVKNTAETTVPLCSIGNKGLFINSQGHFFPCCWVANRYPHNAEWIERGRYFDLSTRTLNDVLNDVFWTTEFKTFRWLECKTKCSQAIVDAKYATEW